MPGINYSIDAKVSPIEWFLLQEFRKVEAHGGGTITPTIVEGLVVGLETKLTQKRENLLKLQT
jgi:hypothetical protein